MSDFAKIASNISIFTINYRFKRKFSRISYETFETTLTFASYWLRIIHINWSRTNSWASVPAEPWEYFLLIIRHHFVEFQLFYLLVDKFDNTSATKWRYDLYNIWIQINHITRIPHDKQIGSDKYNIWLSRQNLFVCAVLCNYLLDST